MDKPHQSENIHKEIAELGFTYVENGCDGLCHECDDMSECAAYKKMIETWNKLYS